MVLHGAWSILKWVRDRVRSGERVRPWLAPSVPEPPTLPDPRDFYAWIGVDEFAIYDAEDEGGDEPQMLFPIPTPCVGEEMMLFDDGTPHDPSKSIPASAISREGTSRGDGRPEGQLTALPRSLGTGLSKCASSIRRRSRPPSAWPGSAGACGYGAANEH